ncbi:hypothetical protein [Mycobacterium attenuatum]|uniref:hypothetical protein n=1 Tax=Mycobacterium attenuatum TaxID=2341086 RepID=UPI000F03EF21|nr:hypothetical protein [Mycobacterium attenuatum]VBA58474.1 hypothetical protein LAUMK41_02988 [Mycobacterium attenuatum]
MTSNEPPQPSRPDSRGLGQVIDRLGPRLRAEFEQLHKFERTILAALAKPEVARQFATDPLATLAALMIDVPPIIKQRLKAAPLTGDAPDLHRPRAFRLPNGQVITAKVNIRFTGSPKVG